MKRFALQCPAFLGMIAMTACLAQAAAPATPGKMPANLGDRPLGSLAPRGDWKKNWTADNGNGTFSNPLFNEEFEDPDPIRVGDTYYLAGTTMHMMPAVQLMQSKDLVNWELASYCMDKLDLGPNYRLDNGNIYGKGIWAPCLRYNNGTFYVFANTNDSGLQVFRSKSPYGPWERNQIPDPNNPRANISRHDLSVLFDDDGRVYMIYNASAPFPIDELAPDLRSVKALNVHRLVVPQGGTRMGEGHHLYKINGKYIDVSAIPGGAVNQVVAKADSIAGPWTVTTMCEGESLGVSANPGGGTSPSDRGVWIHQGGIVDTPTGEWWSVIMSDHGSAGRFVNLVPLTWDDGFPLIGLPGNLRKAPNTWVKPNVGGFKQDPKPSCVHDDSFDNAYLNPNWQWNHVQDDAKWSLTEKPGSLRLHSLPAANFYNARNSLCHRPPAPESIMTVQLNTAGMTNGDTAGLGLLSTPYAWIGVAKTAEGASLQMFTGSAGGRGGGGRRGAATTPATVAAAPPAASVANPPATVWLRVHCNFDTDRAIFSWSADGKEFTLLGNPFTTTFQLTTFQGVRPSLFHFNTSGRPGGYADFENFTVDEPRARGIEREIPAGKAVVFTSGADGSFLAANTNDNTLVNVAAAPAAPANARFQLLDVGLGRVALMAANGKFVSAAGAEGLVLKDLAGSQPGAAESFQWVSFMKGDIMLMSLTNHRYLATKPNTPGPVTITALGATAHRKSGAEFKWKVVD